MAEPSKRKIAYDKELRSNKWKRFRSRVLRRDGYRCTKCGAKDVILHAHHTYYFKGKCHAWEYPLEALVTLCEDCHNAIHNELREKKKRIPRIDNPNKPKQKKKKTKGHTPLKPNPNQKISAKYERKLEEAKRSRRITGKGKNCLAYIQAERIRKREEEQLKNNL